LVKAKLDAHQLDGQQENSFHTEAVIESTVEMGDGWTKEVCHHGSVATLDAKPQDLRDARCFAKSFINRSLVPKLRSVNIGGF